MEINSSITIESICLCTCDAVQYRDGIIIQISAPRDDIEFRVKTVRQYMTSSSGILRLTIFSNDPRVTLVFFFRQPLDRDQPNGRAQWRFTVFAQDEGGEGLVGYADVQVNLKDINDNAPIFPQGVYFGNVTENGTAGL